MTKTEITKTNATVEQQTAEQLAEQTPNAEQTAEQSAEQTKVDYLALLADFIKANSITTKSGVNSRANSTIFNYEKRRVARIALMRDKKTLLVVTSKSREKVAADAIVDKMTALLDAIKASKKTAESEAPNDEQQNGEPSAEQTAEQTEEPKQNKNKRNDKRQNKNK